jgi:hypothetical protein
MEHLSPWELCYGNQERGPFAGDLVGYEKKALETGISLHGGSVGQPGVSLSTGDFERWLKGALEVERLSLWEHCKVNLEGRLPRWRPWRIGRKGSGDRHLLPQRPHWGTW